MGYLLYYSIQIIFENWYCLLQFACIYNINSKYLPILFLQCILFFKYLQNVINSYMYFCINIVIIEINYTVINHGITTSNYF